MNKNDTQPPYTITSSILNLLAAHGLLMYGPVEEPGRYGSGGFGIFQGKQAVHMTRPAERLPRLMGNLFDRLRNTDDQVTGRAANAGNTRRRRIRGFRGFLFSMVLLFLPAAIFCSRTAAAQELLLDDNGGQPKQYLIHLCGRVLNEQFDTAEGVLTLGPAGPGSLDDYRVVVAGYPAADGRNTFYWDSEETDMSCFCNELILRMKRTTINHTGNHFFYLSPVLLKRNDFLNRNADAERKHAERTTNPTKVFALDGRLRLRFYSNTVTGSVWIKGYDNTEHSYVEYSAVLSGRKQAVKVNPSRMPGG